MKYNYSFGKLNDGRIAYAPAAIKDGSLYIVAPTKGDYISRGWMPVVDVAPTTPAPEGYHWAATGWEVVDDTIKRVYTAVVNPPPMPRKFSKLKLYAALTSAGLWDGLENWLKTQTVEGVNAYTAFSLAQDLSEDYPGWADYLGAAKRALGVTDAEVEAILSASVEG